MSYTSLSADLSGLGHFSGLQHLLCDAFASHGCSLWKGDEPELFASVFHGSREAVAEGLPSDFLDGVSGEHPWVVQLAFPAAGVLAAFAGGSYQELVEVLSIELHTNLLGRIFDANA